MVDDRRTVTPAEHAVLDFLADGPAELGARTEALEVRKVPRLWDAGANSTAAARLADATNRATRPVRQVRTVDAKTARRLAKAGLVVLDQGIARLADEVEL